MKPKNLAEALPLLDEPGRLPYTNANARKVRGSVNKCAKPYVYNCPLHMVPIDADAFVKRWKLFMDRGDFPEGFGSFKSFRTWHSNVKSFMEHLSGVRQERDLLRRKSDGWTKIEAEMAELVRPGRSGTGIRCTDIIAMTVLRNTARQHGIEPWQITTQLVAGWFDSCTSAQNAAFRGALDTLNRLHAIAEFSRKDLLPACLGSLPEAGRRRSSRPMAPRFREAVETYLAERASGQQMNGLLKKATRKKVKPTTLKVERDALNWFWDCLLELDLAVPGEDPAPKGFATITIVDAVFGAESEGCLPWKALAPTTLRKNLEAVFRFLQVQDRTIALDRKEFFQADFFKSIESMSEANIAFCKQLVESPPRSWRFLNMARLLHEEASAKMALFQELNEVQKAQACHLALAAVAAAILTFVPLRASTLIAVGINGTDAHVFMPEEKPVVNLTIPPELVKNKVSIEATIEKRGKVNPRKILDWWIGDPRDRVMARIGNPQSDLLLGGATYKHLRRAWTYATATQGCYMNLHQVRHAIASLMINQPNPEINAIAAMLGDTPETVLRTYAFFSRKQAMERGQAGMQRVNKALSLQVGRKAAA